MASSVFPPWASALDLGTNLGHVSSLTATVDDLAFFYAEHPTNIRFDESPHSEYRLLQTRTSMRQDLVNCEKSRAWRDSRVIGQSHSTFRQ